MHVITAYVWDARSVLRADSVRRLARQLYLLCPWWTHESADAIAAQLVAGRVVLVPDFESAFIPGGDFELTVAQPVEDPAWRPDWLGPS
jgi:hypothetical protein